VLPGFCRHRGPPNAIDQLTIEVVLKFFDMTADGGLGEVDGLSGAGKAFCVHNLFKYG